MEFSCFLNSYIPKRTHAFLIGRLRWSHWRNSLNNNLFVLEGMPRAPLRRLSLDFLPLNFISVVASCKGLFCCSTDGTPYVFYICNPATRTWLKLPAPNDLKVWDFIALAFESSTRSCSLVIGRKYIMQEQNNMLVEIYDPDSNSWTKLLMTVKKSVYPQGDGVYSRGRFYWINVTHLGLTMSVYDVVAFNVQEKRWDVVNNPQKPRGAYRGHLQYLQLTGHDGRVVLVYNRDLCLWKLEEDDEKRCKWSVFQILPKTLYGEQECVDFSSEACLQVVVNGNGWILVFLPTKKMVMFDAEGRVLQSMEGSDLDMFRETCPTAVCAFEVNNIWWPS